MSIMYCEKHDRRWDSDWLEECPLCENEHAPSFSNNESNNAAGQVSESPNRQRLGEATAAPTPAASSEQQEYERKRDAHKAADQAAGNRSGDSGFTGSAPVPAAPLPNWNRFLV